MPTHDRTKREAPFLRILVLNCGSSSLKFELMSLASSSALPDRLAGGSISGFGHRAAIHVNATGRAAVRAVADIPDHRAATRWAIEWLGGAGASSPLADAIGHRIVHGGPRLFKPTLIDEAVMREIEHAEELAPLHNAAAIQAVRAAQERVTDSVPMVAVFDTAYHHDLPQHAAQYAIPLETAAQFSIRRYGFHGLAHRYMAERCALLLERPATELRLITLQLGGGCSAAANAGGCSVDTSMGFTPLEGLVMATRSGDIDPAVMRHLCEHGKRTPEQVEDWLNREAGLLGVSGVSGDVRELLRLESQGHARASLALELFCYRVRKYIGAYLAVLAGSDAVVFGGGVGENSPEIRARVCQGTGWCGLRLDDARNQRPPGSEGEISADGSILRAFVVRVDEAILIARDTMDCLLQRQTHIPGHPGAENTGSDPPGPAA